MAGASWPRPSPWRCSASASGFTGSPSTWRCCPRERFAALVGLAVGINQFTFAFGPSLVGVVRDRADGYGPALTACAALQAVAAVIVLLGPGRVRE